jgi:hypothetical protein
MPDTNRFIVTQHGGRHPIDDVVVNDSPPPYTVSFTVAAGVPLQDVFLLDAESDDAVLHAFIAESVDVDSGAPSRLRVRGHFNPAPADNPNGESNHDK